MYEAGRGVDEDYAEAAKWYRKAAEQGNADAQCQLGFMCDFGHGLPKNHAEAVWWYREAAEQGDANGQFNLGLKYSMGQGVLQDMGKAVTWFGKAAEQGNVDAQSWLGLAYCNGWGVPQDDTEARKWSLKAAAQYRTAAERGDMFAQNSLGDCYKNIHYFAEAVKWYLRAAEQGNPFAQNDLGLLYSHGEGVAQNDIEAYKWSSIAAAQGFEDSAKERNLLAQSMSREEIVEGQRRAAAFVARKESPDGSGHVVPSESVKTEDPQQQPPPGYTPFRVGRTAPVNGEEHGMTGFASSGSDQQAGSKGFEEETEEAENVKIVSKIVSQYHRTHTYVGRDIFVCGDMASDVWNMVRTKGINAKIRIGDVENDISSVLQSDHAWVVAEVSPGKWLALETTGGYVVYGNQNKRYYQGHAFSNPKQLKQYSELLKLLRAFVLREKKARESYNQFVEVYNRANSYKQMALKEELGRRWEAENQASTDVNGIARKLKELLEQND